MIMENPMSMQVTISLIEIPLYRLSKSINQFFKIIRVDFDV